MFIRMARPKMCASNAFILEMNGRLAMGGVLDIITAICGLAIVMIGGLMRKIEIMCFMRGAG